jgi:DNA-binding HxlR family transcriptional regulator
MSTFSYVNGRHRTVLLSLSQGDKSFLTLAEEDPARNDIYGRSALKLLLRRLVDAGLVEITEEQENYLDTVYRITSLGRDTLEKELAPRERTERVVQQQAQWQGDKEPSYTTGRNPDDIPLPVTPSRRNVTDKEGQETALRLDTAVPSYVLMNQTFELAAKVVPVTFDTLEEEGLDLVKSAAADISWKKGQREIALRIKVQAPNCTIHGDSETEFRLKRAQASPIFYFQLSPLAPGRLSIIVQLFQETFCLGSVRVATVVTGPKANPVQNFAPVVQAKQEISNIASIACAELNEDRNNIADLIRSHRRRLHILEEKQALQGINTPPDIILEIEDINEQMARLMKQLSLN